MKPRILRHVDDYHFIFPALAWSYSPAVPGMLDGAFAVSFGWWRWHVEFIWDLEAHT